MLSVVICTRNRARSLERVLSSALDLAPIDRAWELLIVDNGGTDDTDAVVQSFESRLPIVLVREEEAGLSAARNRAIATARGDYFLWTDDDVLLDPCWLAAYAEGIERWPSAAVFGGRITPRLEEPMAPWFAQSISDLSFLVAHRDFGQEEIPLSVEADVLPFGANFAIRGAEQRATPYDTALGVKPGRRRGGEETDVIRRILNAGGGGRWLPEPQVFHIIPVERQTRSYVDEYYRALGAAAAFGVKRGGGFDVRAISTAKLFASKIRMALPDRLRGCSEIRAFSSLAFQRGFSDEIGRGAPES